MYKDKDKQREANRRAKVRQRAKGMTEGMTRVDNVIPADVIPEALLPMCQVKQSARYVLTFEDLPPDVQQSIESMSKDAEDKARRTANAIKYQHLSSDAPD